VTSSRMARLKDPVREAEGAYLGRSLVEFISMYCNEFNDTADSDYVSDQLTRTCRALSFGWAERVSVLCLSWCATSRKEQIMEFLLYRSSCCLGFQKSQHRINN